MDNVVKIKSAGEFFYLFSQPTIIMTPFIIMTMYFAMKGFRGKDGILNESDEGWNVVAAAMAWMGICMYYGARNVNIYYGFGDVDWKTVLISLVIITGA